jgi:hypothetical protein
MPDQPATTSVVSGAPKTPDSQRGPTINISREFGTAQRKLPPANILVAATAGVLVIAGIVSLLQRPKPQATGTIVYASAVQIPKQNAVLAALTFVLRNPGQKPLWVKSIQGKLVTASGELTGDAISAVDFDRYYQAFPALKNNAEAALAPEDKLQPGQEVKRTVIVSFPTELDAFNQRKSVNVILQPYDQPMPVIVSQ